MTFYSRQKRVDGDKYYEICADLCHRTGIERQQHHLYADWLRVSWEQVKVHQRSNDQRRPMNRLEFNE